MSLSIRAKETHGVTVLELEGRLVAGPEASALQERVKRLVEEKKTRLVLNLEKVSFVDSTGAGALVRSLGLAKKAGGSLKAAKPNEQFRQVLKLTQIVKILEIYDSEEEAVASFG